MFCKNKSQSMAQSVFFGGAAQTEMKKTLRKTTNAAKISACTMTVEKFKKSYLMDTPVNYNASNLQ